MKKFCEMIAEKKANLPKDRIKSANLVKGSQKKRELRQRIAGKAQFFWKDPLITQISTKARGGKKQIASTDRGKSEFRQRIAEKTGTSSKDCGKRVNFVKGL